MVLSLCMSQLIHAAVIDQWTFNYRSVKNGAFTNSSRPKFSEKAKTFNATTHGPVDFTKITSTLRLTGETFLTVDEAFTANDMPSDSLSIEAWVMIDSDSAGTVIACSAPNTAAASGWNLGFDGSHFTFTLHSANASAAIESKHQITPGTWYHLAASYDGSVASLYLDSELESQSDTAGGPINYKDAVYTIASDAAATSAQKLHGGLFRIKVHNATLSAEDVRVSFVTAGPVMSPEPVVYFENTGASAGPWLVFAADNSAIVSWETQTPMPSILIYGPEGSLDERIENSTKTQKHSIKIPNLRHNARYSYALVSSVAGKEAVSNNYLCDTFFNYNKARQEQSTSPFSGKRAEAAAQSAEKIIAKIGNAKGLCLDIGSGDAALAYEIARQSGMKVIAVDTDAKNVAKLRKTLRSAGVYGAQVTVKHVDSYTTLPFKDNTFNLIVSGSALLDGRQHDLTQAESLLRPSAMAFLDNSLEPKPKGSVAASADWTHQYGGAHNASYEGESLSGATSIDELDVQWIGRPGPRAMVDRNSRVPAPLSVGGRLFTQGYNRIIAQDAYNGTILWSLELPNSIRMNMPRDAANWCADDEALYIAVRDKCLKIDVENGAILSLFNPADGPDNNTDYDWGYIAQSGDQIIGSTVKTGASYTGFWSGENWYDQHMPGYGDAQGYGAGKVSSDIIFAADRNSGEIVWQHDGSVILNTTITSAKGQLYFIECRNRQILKAANRRIIDKRLFQDLYLVSIDEQDGTKVWERKLKLPSDIPVLYLAYGEGSLVLVTSVDSKKSYEIMVYDSANGNRKWKKSHLWPSDNHSGHMQHQVVVNGMVYVEPLGYDLTDGTVLTENMGRHEGCATYAASSNALIYRGRGRRIAMWDMADESFSAWDRLRPGCWLTTIPAAGMVLSPEAGGGCSCGNWMETSLAFAPLPCPPPAVERSRNRFVESLDVTLTVPKDGAVIRYTLDGSHPDSESPEYRTPVRVTESSTILARAYLPGGASSPESAHRYHEIIPEEAVSVESPQKGIRYAYLDATELPASLESLNLEFSGTAEYFDPSSLDSNSKKAVMFSGLIELPENALYSFHIASNEQAALYIGGKKIGIPKGGSVQQAEIGLKKGLHKISVFSSRNNTVSDLTIEYSTDGIEKLPVTDAMLMHE